MVREVVERYGGEVPGTKDELMSLPRVSDYVASAVVCFSSGEPTPIVPPVAPITPSDSAAFANMHSGKNACFTHLARSRVLLLGTLKGPFASEWRRVLR
jgi:hypothetical protein